MSQLILIIQFLLTVYLGEADLPNLSILLFSLLPWLSFKLKLNWTMLFLVPLGIFYHWILLGKTLTPETAFHFFLVMLCLKFFQSSTRRDLIFIALTEILVLAALALLNTSLLSLCFIVVALLNIMLMLTNQKAQVEWQTLAPRLKSLALSVLITFPIFLVLFFFFPRFKTQIFNLGQNNRGEIGYQAEIRNDEISELNQTNKEALKIFPGPKFNFKLPFYLRGAVLEHTDGYNWYRRKNFTPYQQQPFTESLYEVRTSGEWKSDVIYLQPFSPIAAQDTVLMVDEQNLSLKAQGEIFQYQVGLTPQNLPTTIIRAHTSLSPFAKKILLGWGQDLDKSNIPNFIKSFEAKLKREKFQYTLAPGRMHSLDEFLEKKQGYCSHYSSLLATLLRLHSFPSRIISGFLGGEWNEYGGYYSVSMNDAHAWVEYFDQGQWQRIDPTLFVAPARLEQGLAQASRNYQWGKAFNFKWLYSAKLYYEYLNFQVKVFFENFDRSYQEFLAKKMGLELKRFYLVLPIGLSLMLILLFLYFSVKAKRKIPEHEMLLKTFYAKFGLNPPATFNFAKIREQIGEKAAAMEFINEYEKIRYSKKHTKNLKDLKKWLKQL